MVSLTYRVLRILRASITAAIRLEWGMLQNQSVTSKTAMTVIEYPMRIAATNLLMVIHPVLFMRPLRHLGSLAKRRCDRLAAPHRMGLGRIWKFRLLSRL